MGAYCCYLSSGESVLRAELPGRSNGGQYLKPQDECKFQYAEAAVDLNVRRRFGPDDVSVNVTRTETYLPLLQETYSQGYRMLTFCGVYKRMHELYDNRAPVVLTVQGIFRKAWQEEEYRNWELRMEKSILKSQLFVTWKNISLGQAEEVSNITDTKQILQAVENIVKNGGRLLRIELTGLAGKRIKKIQERQIEMAQEGMPIPTLNISCDIFFETARQLEEQEISKVVHVPMFSTISGAQGHTWRTKFDWQSTLTEYLGTGWRLDDVFMDMSSQETFSGQGSYQNYQVSLKKNTAWFFAKPESKANDLTPMYEGCVVEFTLRLGSCISEESQSWEPTILEMSKRGWNVVCILPSGDLNMTGLCMQMNMLYFIFFQRRIVMETLHPPTQIPIDREPRDCFSASPRADSRSIYQSIPEPMHRNPISQQMSTLLAEEAPPPSYDALYKT